MTTQNNTDDKQGEALKLRRLGGSVTRADEMPDRIWVSQVLDDLGTRSWGGYHMRQDDIEYVRAATTPPATPSDAAMRAARNAVEELKRECLLAETAPEELNEIAAIITRNLVATPSPEVVQEVYVSEYPVTLQCNQCGLVQVMSFKCPKEDGQLVLPESETESQFHRELIEAVIATSQCYDPSHKCDGVTVHRESFVKALSDLLTVARQEERKAAPETAVGGEAQKCVKCGHDDGVDANGVCRNKDYDPSNTSCLCHGCLCKCEFAAAALRSGEGS